MLQMLRWRSNIPGDVTAITASAQPRRLFDGDRTISRCPGGRDPVAATPPEHPARPARLPGVIELRRAVPFLTFAVALLVAGCALLPGPFAKTKPEGSPVPIGDERVALNLAAERWAAVGTDNYRLDLGFLCACAVPPRVIVEVVDGVPTATDGDGKPLDADKLAFTPITIDQLFAEGRKALTNGGTVDVALDPLTGLPNRFDIDYLPQAIDDELSIVVNAFEPAP